jgi:hypothetical protein
MGYPLGCRHFRRTYILKCSLRSNWTAFPTMIKKMKQRTFDQAIADLRSQGFDVSDMVPVAGGAASPEKEVLVTKNGCGAMLLRQADGFAALSAQPGVLLGGEIARLLDRGYQKFFKTTKLEVPVTAAHLKAVHDFTEELKLATGSVSLYNESLGTVSDRYLYDRLKGRDLPVSERPVRPWQVPENQ